MTRFVYITDSHIGASEHGYQQQQRYACYLPELMQALDTWISNHQIDFVLHGGDVVDEVSIQTLNTARELLSLSVPVYVCLGNHDMTHPHAAEMWQSAAPALFVDGELEFAITHENTLIYVMPNHWCEIPYFWDGQHQAPHFTQTQLDKLHHILASAEDKNVLLCTHNEVAAVPTSQTGFSEPYHNPPEPFMTGITNLLKQQPNIRTILAGHNHINTCVNLGINDVRALTVSSFSEVPFEFKVIEVHQNGIIMHTENLVHYREFKASYNYDKTFVQGRSIDRTFELTW